MVSATRMEDSQATSISGDDLRRHRQAMRHRTRRLLRDEQFDGTAIDVGLNRSPERTTSAAAAETHTADGNAKLSK